MNCLIVDDEILAQDVIAHYISKLRDMHLLGRCTNAVEAYHMLGKAKVDLMFLDIKMPEITGLDLIRNLPLSTKVILTTAYSEYALEAYELNVADYLMKPISFDRFLKAVHKAKALSLSHSLPHEVKSSEEIFVKSDRKLIKIVPQEIVCIEGQKNYLLIHTHQSRVMTYSTMANMEEALNAYPFLIRVHKSYLVNRHKILSVDNGIIKMQHGLEVPLGSTYKESFLQQMKII